MKKPSIVTVVGSINMDLTVQSSRIPNKGETIIGESFSTHPGGKGANQAVAAARLGAKVNMIGAVGYDEFGKSLLNHLEEEGINTKGISMIENASTGIATILVSENDNRIIVASGANAQVTPSVVEMQQDLILESDVVLLQLEIPMETVEYATKLCRENQIPVIINPAPFQKLTSDLIQSATYLTPNEVEAAEIVVDNQIDLINEKLVVTKGENGVEYYKNNTRKVIPAFNVTVEDTTGAGDTFNGALATRIGSGDLIEEAVFFANAASALSVTKFGAQGGMPTEQQVKTFIQERCRLNEKNRNIKS